MMKTGFIAEVLLILCRVVTLSTGANILAFYPFPCVSHHRVYWPLLRELALRNHNVTMVSPYNMAEPPPNYKEIKVPDYSEECRFLNEEYIKESNQVTKFWKNEDLFMLREMNQFHTEKILEDPAVQWLISSDSKFDIIIGEFSFAEEAFIALTHRFNAIYIELTSYGNCHWTYWLYGNPLDTSYIVDAEVAYTDNMNFIARLHNTVFSLTYRLLWYYYFMPSQQILADKYIRYNGWDKRPSIGDILSDNTSLLLMNTHYSLNYPYPLAPHVKEIGGLNIQNQEISMPKQIKEFMDGSKHGVIYFSMGTYLVGSSTFEKSVRDDFIQVFSELKQRVIWKFETDIPNLPPNVMISKWLPQISILAHPKSLVFISHCGFLSLSEAIDKGVPMVAIPVFADQYRNAKLVSHKGLGITMDIGNLTKKSISWAINEIIDNPSYKVNIQKQSMMFHDKPMTALETAVYWTEYVIRHNGAPHLRPAIATMPWYQQAMLDVYSIMVVMLLIPLYILYKSLRCLCRYIRSNRCFCKLLRDSSRNKPLKKQKSQ